MLRVNELALKIDIGIRVKQEFFAPDIGIEPDNLFPPSIAPKTMQLFKDAGVNASFFELESNNGHRAPSIDWQSWADILRDFLKTNASLSSKGL